MKNIKQTPGTELCIRLNPTIIYCIWKVSPKIFLALIILLGAFKFSEYLIFGSVLIMLIVCYQFLYLRNIIYEIDNEMIKVKTGLIGRRTDSLELYRVKDYLSTQNMLMRIFKIETVTLYTTDLTNGVLKLKGIPAQGLDRVIREYVQIARRHNKILEYN